MICDTQSEGYELLVDGVSTRFALAPDGITVGHILSLSDRILYDNSWVITVVSPVPVTSCAKETYFLT